MGSEKGEAVGPADARGGSREEVDPDASGVVLAPQLDAGPVVRPEVRTAQSESEGDECIRLNTVVPGIWVDGLVVKAVGEGGPALTALNACQHAMRQVHPCGCRRESVE